MGRLAVSEAFLLKAQCRRGHKESEEVVSGVSVPSEAGVALQQTPKMLQRRQEDSNAKPLQSREQQFAEMIQHIFPVPTKSTSSSRLASRRTVKVVAPHTPEPPRGVSSPSETEPRRPQAKNLSVLLKERAWNPQEFPLRKNCVGLVRGALATRIERALGGSLVFINEASGRKGERNGRRKEGHPLHDFRRRLLQKWPTIQEGFAEIDGYMSKVTRPLNVLEWTTALGTLGLAGQSNARLLYDLLDENKDGTLTLEEFRNGIEIVAPVLCLDAFRKRLLCLGFPSMCAAVSAMQPPGEDIMQQPLSFSQFAECLSRVWVIQPEEHRAIFERVRDPWDAAATVTLGELLCGLAAVSPPLLLEELRLLALRRRGSVEAALDAIKARCGLKDEVEEMPEQLLERSLHELFGFRKAETQKLAPLIDVDGVQGISINELRSALMLAEPSLSIEAARKKIQFGYRSISAVLESVVEQSPDYRADIARFQKEEIASLLESVDGVEPFDMNAVIAFVSRASGEIGMTLEGFLKGLRLFAPSSILEGLRLQLAGREAKAFSEVPNKRTPLNLEQFAAALEEADIQLPLQEVSTIFGLLDVRNAHVVTIRELISLLQCSRARGRPFRAEAELERRATQRVRKDFAPIRKGLRELKHGIRVARLEGQEVESTNGEGRRLSSSMSLPDLRSHDTMPMARKTFQRISSTLDRVPDGDDEHGTKIVEIKEELGGYFESRQRALGSHEELLEQPILGQADGYSLACKLRKRAQLP